MIVVVHQKGKSKPKMSVFLNDSLLDRILNGHARKPIIPAEEEILDIGIGDFIESWKKKHSIKTHKIVDI